MTLSLQPTGGPRGPLPVSADRHLVNAAIQDAQGCVAHARELGAGTTADGLQAEIVKVQERSHSGLFVSPTPTDVTNYKFEQAPEHLTQFKQSMSRKRGDNLLDAQFLSRSDPVQGQRRSDRSGRSEPSYLSFHSAPAHLKVFSRCQKGV
jgi:hypothetical protein